MSNPVTKAIEEILKAEVTGVDNETLKSALRRRQEQKSEKLAEALSGVFEEAENAINVTVQRLRDIRRGEKRCKQELADIVRRVEYAKATGNVMPLRNFSRRVMQVANMLNGVDLNNTELYKVPNDWHPTHEE